MNTSETLAGLARELNVSTQEARDLFDAGRVACDRAGRLSIRADKRASACPESAVMSAREQAWEAMSEALAANAQGHCSAADVCAVGFEWAEKLADSAMAARLDAEPEPDCGPDYAARYRAWLARTDDAASAR